MVVPEVGVGAIVIRDGAILLVQRGREPHKGLWAIPGGRIEPGESLHQATCRELLEETGIRVKVGDLAWHFEHIAKDDNGELLRHYVVLDFWADYVDGEPVAGDDAVAARWVALSDLADWPLNETSREALSTLLPQIRLAQGQG